MTSFLRYVEEHPVRVSIVLAAVLAGIELTLLMVPGLPESIAMLGAWLPWAGALVGGLIVRSWWWLLIYPLGIVVGLMLWGALYASGALPDLGTLGWGAIELATFLLPSILLLAALGPLYASLHRRVGRRMPRKPPQVTDQAA
jgi:hypothetical protein